MNDSTSNNADNAAKTNNANDNSTSAYSMPPLAEMQTAIAKRLEDAFHRITENKKLHEITVYDMAAPEFEMVVAIKEKSPAAHDATTAISARNLLHDVSTAIVELSVVLSQADIDKLHIALNNVYHKGLHCGVARVVDMHEQLTIKKLLDAASNESLDRESLDS